jgi:ECF sigma factor
MYSKQATMSQKKRTDEVIFLGCRRNDRLSQEQCYRNYFADCMQLVAAYTPDLQEGLKIVNAGFMIFFKEVIENQFITQSVSVKDIQKCIYKSLCEAYQNDTQILNFIFFETHDMRGTELSLAQLNWKARLQLLEVLHPSQQKIVKARIVEGISVTDIARSMNLTNETIERTLTESRSFLKQILLNPANQAVININQNEYKL